MATFTSNGTPITQPSPQYDLPIYCNNGKISVLDHTNWNVITNPNQEAGKGMFINTSGVLSKASDRGAGAIIPITVGKKYTMLINKKTLGLGNFLRYGQSATSTPSGQQLVDWYAGVVQDGQIVSFTAKKDYFVFQMGADFVEGGGIDEAIEVIESAGNNETIVITDENNTTVGTATANNLFAINTYKDVQEIITGATTHNCGIRVFDGTESWREYTAGSGYYLSVPTMEISTQANYICSHAKAIKSIYEQGMMFGSPSGNRIIYWCQTNSLFATVEDLNTWLAAQYTAGTPVTIVFPLETPFEEVAPIAQSMTVVDGDNTVSLTQQGMTPLELEATYQKAKY